MCMYIRSTRTPILLFDNVYDCQTIEQLISAAGSLPKRPYIISTLCSGGTTRGVPLHQLMFRHNIRVVTCSSTEEPIYGILARTLRKRLYRLKAELVKRRGGGRERRERGGGRERRERGGGRERREREGGRERRERGGGRGRERENDGKEGGRKFKRGSKEKPK